MGDGWAKKVFFGAPGVERSARRHRGDGGFTLVEVLVAVAILSLVMVAVGAVSLSGVQVMGDQTLDRHLDSTTAQFVSVRFARDVQGAAGLSATTCGGSGLGVPLTTLRASDDGSIVAYLDRLDGTGHALVRVECDSSGTLLSVDPVVEGLDSAPTVSCSPAACATTGTPPRVVTLSVTRTDQFSFAVDGSRRSTDEPVIGPILPAELFALGGGKPLSVQGNGNLVVDGNAFVNSSSSQAVSLSGNNSRLSVTEDFKILDGGGCSGCNAAQVTPFPPGSYPAPLPDPLGYLPPPDESTLSAGSCSAGVCSPGVYEDELKITGSATFQAGTYVLHKGLSITGNGTISGSEVFLFNGCGEGAPGACDGDDSFRISGQAAVSLSPPTSGTYAGILYYQSRDNDSGLAISGGSNLMLFSGVLYAPNSDQVALGAGGGGLRLGAVIGQSLKVSGNGTVQVDGT